MTDGDASRQETEWFGQEFDKIQGNIGRFIRGKDSVISVALVCLAAEGHLLIDDVPGLGKTSLAKAITQSIRGSMNRIQFTPDLLPSDVTGVHIYSKEIEDFRFHEGPVFANVVLADEINRASPKTQSALLEVMEERQITTDGNLYKPPRPFIVVATQNPVELDGTYHLPEAQIDRFMMKITIGYPDHADEVEILQNRTSGVEVSDLDQVSAIEDIQRMIHIARRVRVPSSVHDVIVRIVSATRHHNNKDTRLGVSPRGALSLAQASQAWAASKGRNVVTMDDVKAMARPVLSHRIFLNADAEIQGLTRDGMIEQIIHSVPMPVQPTGV